MGRNPGAAIGRTDRQCVGYQDGKTLPVTSLTRAVRFTGSTWTRFPGAHVCPAFPGVHVRPALFFGPGGSASTLPGIRMPGSPALSERGNIPPVPARGFRFQFPAFHFLVMVKAVFVGPVGWPFVTAARAADGSVLEPMGSTRMVEPIAAATAIVDAMPNPPRITHDGGNRAYYVPIRDSIHMPTMNSFHSAGEYHSTLFHELSHSTGHESRLNRNSLETPAPFGSDVYSREELVAEFGASFLSATAGIDNTLANSASYIGGWSRALKADNRLVVSAASQGQKAADFILGGE